ncbi:hypothetical protein CBR_g75513, partial [Chara braunii]
MGNPSGKQAQVESWRRFCEDALQKTPYNHLWTLADDKTEQGIRKQNAALRSYFPFAMAGETSWKMGMDFFEKWETGRLLAPEGAKWIAKKKKVKGVKAGTGSCALAKQGKLGMQEAVHLVKCDHILVRLWNYYQFKYENRPDSDWTRSYPFLRKREAILVQFKSQGLDAALWDRSRKLVGDSSLFRDCPPFMGCEDDKSIKAMEKLVLNKKLSIDWKNKVLSVLTGSRSKSMDVSLAEGMVHIRWQDLGDVTSIAPFGVDPLEAQMKVVELEKAVGVTKCHVAVLDLCEPMDITQWTQQAFESLNALLQHLFPSHWTVIAFVPREHDYYFMTSLHHLSVVKLMAGKWVRRPQQKKSFAVGNNLYSVNDRMYILFKGDDLRENMSVVYDARLEAGDAAAVGAHVKVTPTDVSEMPFELCECPWSYLAVTAKNRIYEFLFLETRPRRDSDPEYIRRKEHMLALLDNYHSASRLNAKNFLDRLECLYFVELEQELMVASYSALIDTDEEATTGVIFDTNVPEEDSDTEEIALNYLPAPFLPPPGSSTAGSAVPPEDPSWKDESIHFEGHDHTRSSEADWGHDMIWHPGTIQPAIREGEWIMAVVDSVGQWEPCSRLPKSEYLQLASSGVADKVALESPRFQATDPAVVKHADRLFLELQDKGWLELSDEFYDFDTSPWKGSVDWKVPPTTGSQGSAGGGPPGPPGGGGGGGSGKGTGEGVASRGSVGTHDQGRTLESGDQVGLLNVADKTTVGASKSAKFADIQTSQNVEPPPLDAAKPVGVRAASTTHWSAFPSTTDFAASVGTGRGSSVGVPITDVEYKSAAIPTKPPEVHDGEPVLRSATGAEVSKTGAKTKSAGIRTSVSSGAPSDDFPTRQGTASAVGDGQPAEFNARLDSGAPSVLCNLNSAGIRTCWGRWWSGRGGRTAGGWRRCWLR